jgi:hypothetical protein
MNKFLLYFLNCLHLPSWKTTSSFISNSTFPPRRQQFWMKRIYATGTMVLLRIGKFYYRRISMAVRLFTEPINITKNSGATRETELALLG